MFTVARNNPKEATLTNAGPRDSIPSGTADSTGIERSQILASIGEVAYEWRLDSDVLSWGGNVADVLLIKDRAPS